MRLRLLYLISGLLALLPIPNFEMVNYGFFLKTYSI